MRVQRCLYLMVKPPPELALSIAALPHYCAKRSAALLHMTVLALTDDDGELAAPIIDLRRVLDQFRAPPFEVRFDRIRRQAKCVTLLSTRGSRGAKTFRQLLIDHLIDLHGLPIKRAGTLWPHITLNYASPGDPFTEDIPPICWQVEEFQLIESVTGQTHHIAHGSWPLRKCEKFVCHEIALPLFRTGISSVSLQT